MNFDSEKFRKQVQQDIDSDVPTQKQKDLANLIWKTLDEIEPPPINGTKSAYCEYISKYNKDYQESLLWMIGSWEDFAND